MGELYPRSHIEIDGTLARYYEQLLNLITLGKYSKFIENAIQAMDIQPEDRILDLGAGTGYNAEYMVKYLNTGGRILGLDISRVGIERFRDKFQTNPAVRVENRRVDKPLPYNSEFDKVLTSFVIHGLPHPARENLIKNAFKALKSGGKFFILDYGEFELGELPLHIRLPFRAAECKYAYDYISRDWEAILVDFGFRPTGNQKYFDGFTRLLEAKKQSG
ncbi:MAG: class I SAM-dependent methyltransferase [Candidatus Bipolaricaulota bacterium]